eukprot:1112351-Rhodomonas_salina.1
MGQPTGSHPPVAWSARTPVQTARGSGKARRLVSTCKLHIEGTRQLTWIGYHVKARRNMTTSWQRHSTELVPDMLGE